MKNSVYLEILRCALLQTAPDHNTISSISLHELYEFSSLNKLIPIVSKLLPYWPITTSDEQELVNWWKNEATGLVFLEYNKHTMLKQLLLCANERNIPLLFFKGYILANLYPEFTLRNSSDTDIYVAASSLDDAITLLTDLNYSQAKELDEDDVFTFLYEKDGCVIHKIELHTSLYEDLTQKQIEILDQIKLISNDTTIALDCCKLTLQTLNHENHLIYQIIHMAKHLCSHGFPARYLLDTALFINNYHSQINWKNVEQTITELGFFTFYHQLLSILIHNFDVPEHILCGKKIHSATETDELLTDILQFGMRSHSESLSHYFFCFEQYLEASKNQTNDITISNISFDGRSVPTNIVPLKYQSNALLQNRIHFLQKLNLL